MAFIPADFKEEYPQFADLSDATLTNTYDYNAVPNSKWVFLYTDWDASKQQYWQNRVLAHILTIQYGQNGNGVSTSLPGRLSNVSTGDVNVQLDYAIAKNSAEAEWNKTTYGQEIYKMMSSIPVCDYIC